ncbi:MAG: hypothetical protein ABJA74_07575 [Lapillicoccus sp.]
MNDQTGAGGQQAVVGETDDVDTLGESRADRSASVPTDERDNVSTDERNDVPAGERDDVKTDESVKDAGDDPAPAAREEDTWAPRDEADDRADDRADDKAADQEREQAAEEFAREHDPAKHDVSAGDELRQGGDWTANASGGAQVWDAEGNLVEGSSPGQPGPDSAASASSEPGDTADGGRRTSSLDEIRDGGYGLGSAAPLDDGALPLGHSVKAWEDTKTFVTPDHAKYGEAEPHVWFVDAHAAEAAGFHPVD